jgi:DNA polymerase epsilon subunit 1
MAEFLGTEIIKGKGLNCSFIISKKPLDLPVADRSIPISIFNADYNVKKKYLRKWLKEN